MINYVMERLESIDFENIFRPCERQKIIPDGYTRNRAGHCPLIGAYFGR